MQATSRALVTAAARRVAGTASATRRVAAVAARCSSTQAVFEAPDADFVRFPREQSGLNYGLNWSLADDDVTPRGRAFRNLPAEELAEYATEAKVKEGDAPLYATDEFAGFEVADIDAFEERLEKLKDSFMAQPNLFVEDGAVGSERGAEIRVRVISDSANYALFFRTMLQRVPLKDPQTIPRPLIVYVATNLSDESNYTVSDFDPETGRGVVAVSGNPGFEAVRAQVQHVAAQMFAHGGYAGQRGGGVRVQLARDDGSLDFDDSHYIAENSTGNVLLPGAVQIAEDGSTAVHIGTEVADAGLYAAHACVWNPAGLAAFWGGALTSSGAAAVDASATKLVAHPSKIVAPGGASDAAELAASLGMSEAAAEALAARVAEHGVEIVASAAAAGGKKKKAAASGGKKKKATKKKA